MRPDLRSSSGLAADSSKKRDTSRCASTAAVRTCKFGNVTNQGFKTLPTKLFSMFAFINIKSLLICIHADETKYEFETDDERATNF